jgi:putative component of toxin-antitoxin plasmid stabilization module
MTKFDKIEFKEVDCFNRVFHLGINGKYHSVEFWKEISKDGNLRRQLEKISSRLQDVSQGLKLPQNKFRDITNDNSVNRLCEVKTDNLRLYLIKDTSNVIYLLLLGGKKGEQKKDIDKAKRIFNDFNAS